MSGTDFGITEMVVGGNAGNMVGITIMKRNIMMITEDNFQKLYKGTKAFSKIKCFGPLLCKYLDFTSKSVMNHVI